jgi:hypothetical protein
MKSQFASIFLITVFLLSAQSVAMKSRREALSRSCDEVWRAAIAVATNRRAKACWRRRGHRRRLIPIKAQRIWGQAKFMTRIMRVLLRGCQDCAP